MLKSFITRGYWAMIIKNAKIITFEEPNRIIDGGGNPHKFPEQDRRGFR